MANVFIISGWWVEKLLSACACLYVFFCPNHFEVLQESRFFSQNKLFLFFFLLTSLASIPLYFLFCLLVPQKKFSYGPKQKNMNENTRPKNENKKVFAL